MQTFKQVLELQQQNPEIFQAGFFLAIIFFVFLFLWFAVLDIVAAFVFYINEKTRAIKIENDKKDPPKKLFTKLFKKKEKKEC